VLRAKDGLVWGIALALVLSSAHASAQPAAVEDPRDEGGRRVFGVGGDFALDLGASHFNAGGRAFFEFEAIEHLLTIEAGLSFVKVASGTELSTEILLKKPFHLRRGFELEVGLGPAAVQTLGTVPNATYFAIAGVLDFKFWPTDRFGFWVAPHYDLVFRNQGSLTVGASVGPMISWR
jgi:hypothetical protein